MKLGHHHHYDPETDAPALGQQLTASNSCSNTDLLLVAFVLPFALGLAINFATALLRSPEGGRGDKQESKQHTLLTNRQPHATCQDAPKLRNEATPAVLHSGADTLIPCNHSTTVLATQPTK